MPVASKSTASIAEVSLIRNLLPFRWTEIRQGGNKSLIFPNIPYPTFSFWKCPSFINSSVCSNLLPQYSYLALSALLCLLNTYCQKLFLPSITSLASVLQSFSHFNGFQESINKWCLVGQTEPKYLFSRDNFKGLYRCLLYSLFSVFGNSSFELPLQNIY